MPEVLKKFMDRYGQIAFGVIALCIIWFFIVRPELRDRKNDVQEYAQIAEGLRDAARSVEHASEINERITIQLREIVVRLDKQR